MIPSDTKSLALFLAAADAGDSKQAKRPKCVKWRLTASQYCPLYLELTSEVSQGDLARGTKSTGYRENTYVGL